MKLNKHAWTIWGIALAVVIALMILIPFNHMSTIRALLFAPLSG